MPVVACWMRYRPSNLNRRCERWQRFVQVTMVMTMVICRRGGVLQASAR